MKANPRAYSFKVWDCGDPTCGMHIISFDEHQQVILETVMSPEQTRQVVRAGMAILIGKRAAAEARTRKDRKDG